MPDKKILINYTNRDFNSIKRDLEEHARRYYPDTYKDFSENSFGSYVLDTVFVAHVFTSPYQSPVLNSDVVRPDCLYLCSRPPTAPS